MRVYYWTSVSLRRLYIDQFPSIHFKDWDEVFVSKGSKDISHANKTFSCTMELPNKSARFVVIFFCLFCFHLGRICDLYFRQKYWKSFYSYDRNVLFGYDVIRGIQEATSISFFSFCGVSKWESKENTLHCWVVDQSTGFLLACRSHLNI